MEVSSLLSHEPAQNSSSLGPVMDSQHQPHAVHPYPTRHSASSNAPHMAGDRYTTPPVNTSHGGGEGDTTTAYAMSPQSSPAPKHVAFELLFNEGPNYRARLPMRVQIFPHDTTESIVTTVKNFYGLYEGPGGASGVIFEDERGNTLIARYENFHNSMTVYVRVVVSHAGTPEAYQPAVQSGGSPAHLQQGFQDQNASQSYQPQPAQALTYGQPASRPASRATRRQTQSPLLGDDHRSASANGKMRARLNRSRSGLESEFNPEGGNGGSDDEGNGSTTSSLKAKSEQLASAEISLDNILEHGRRKRPKFESSELPLFVPPQVPLTASTSSVSPVRRTTTNQAPSPFAHPSQLNFTRNHALPSPQSFGKAFPPPSHSTFSTPTAPHNHRLRTRNAAHPPTRSTGGLPTPGGPGILPTPDPTIASCISDEDVALQLMRLGDASNLSLGTQPSTSPLDDSLSGAADVASSGGESCSEESDSEGQSNLPRLSRSQLESSPLPAPGYIRKRHKRLDEILPSQDSTTETSEAEEDGNYTDSKVGSQETFMNELEQVVRARAPQHKHVNDGVNKSRSGASSVRSAKSSKPRPVMSHKAKAKSNLANATKAPISPASLPPQSRKPSVASAAGFPQQLGEDEEDLSSKPRCQRCRKSKKGCDRQRPCQRCKDAGIGADGCVSEDEGNGRKGRYGRHMGVTVKKGSVSGSVPGSVNGDAMSPPVSSSVAGFPHSPEKSNSKKRKR